MSILKQRVPMATVEGSKAFITTEWLKDLRTEIASVTVAASSAASTGATAQDIADLLALITALALRVTKLEGGFQA